MRFIPPREMAREANRGLKMAKKFKRGGTEIGRNMARTIVRAYLHKTGLSEAQVIKINSYFPRHQFDRWDEVYPIPTNGAIAWMLWGGWSGWEWTQKMRSRYGF